MNWFEELRTQQQDSVRWYSEEECEACAARMTKKYEGSPPFVPLTSAARGLSQALLERMRPVGEVGLGPMRPSVVEQRALLFIEHNDPQHLLVALHEEVPPLLWFPAGQTLESLAAGLVPYRKPRAAPNMFAMHGMERGFLGTEGILEMSREELLAHLSTHPLGESLFWGSVHDADPWPEHIGIEDVSLFAEEAASYMAQREGAVWSLSFRSLASRAVLTLEDHQGFFVLQVRYDPAPHKALIQAFNGQFGLHWPADLPLDVATLLIGLFFEDEGRLQTLLLDRPFEDDPSGFVFNLYAYASTRWGDLGLLSTLWGLSTHRELEVRTVVADIAIRHGYDALLAVMAEQETHDALRRELSERI